MATSIETDPISSTGTRLFSLPVELVDRILDFCDSRDLLKLICASRLASEIVEPVLYRHPRIVDLRGAEAFASAVNKDPRRAAWTRALTLDGSEYPNDDATTLIENTEPLARHFIGLVALQVAAEDYRNSYHFDLREVLVMAEKLPSLQTLIARSVCFGEDRTAPYSVFPGISRAEIFFGECLDCASKSPLAGICSIFPNAVDLHLDITYCLDEMDEDDFAAFEAMARLRNVAISGYCRDFEFWLRLWDNRPRGLQTFTINAGSAYGDTTAFGHFDRPLPMISHIEYRCRTDDYDAVEAAAALDQGTFPALRSFSFPTNDLSEAAAGHLDAALRRARLEGSEGQGKNFSDGGSRSAALGGDGFVSGRLVLTL